MHLSQRRMSLCIMLGGTVYPSVNEPFRDISMPNVSSGGLTFSGLAWTFTLLLEKTHRDQHMGC